MPGRQAWRRRDPPREGRLAGPTAAVSCAADGGSPRPSPGPRRGRRTLARSEGRRRVPRPLLLRRAAGRPAARARPHPPRGRGRPPRRPRRPAAGAADPRPGGGAALQFEVALDSLDQLERVRHDGGPDEDIGDLMHAFSEILLAPPAVEILRVDEAPAPAGKRLGLSRLGRGGMRLLGVPPGDCGPTAGAPPGDLPPLPARGGRRRRAPRRGRRSSPPAAADTALRACSRRSTPAPGRRRPGPVGPDGLAAWRKSGEACRAASTAILGITGFRGIGLPEKGPAQVSQAAVRRRSRWARYRLGRSASRPDADLTSTRC